MSKGKV